MKKIYLTKGMHCVVDDSDFRELSRHKWCVSQKGRKTKKWYAVRSKSVIENNEKICRMVSMHREIMKLPSMKMDPRIVDHLDGDSLNNQRGNLQILSGHAANMARVENWVKKREVECFL